MRHSHRRAARLAAIALLATVAGCADPAHNLYEGVRTRDDAMRSPVEKATQPSPPYEQYDKERPGRTP